MFVSVDAHGALNCNFPPSGQPCSGFFPVQSLGVVVVVERKWMVASVGALVFFVYFVCFWVILACVLTLDCGPEHFRRRRRSKVVQHVFRHWDSIEKYETADENTRA